MSQYQTKIRGLLIDDDVNHSRNLPPIHESLEQIVDPCIAIRNS